MITLQEQKVNLATFFISTGRCGTQWFTNLLQVHYPDLVDATHEPLGFRYQPKKYLRSDRLLTDFRDEPHFAEHLIRIKTTLNDRHYVETGWPCYPALPLLKQELGEKLRIVHVVRHPVRVALSLATHNLFQRSEMAQSALTPFDSGVLQKSLRERWENMSEYERCLFWWTEINGYGVEFIRENPEIPAVTSEFESLFLRHKLESILAFMGLPWRDSVTSECNRPFDRYKYNKAGNFDVAAARNFPLLVELAERFGMDLSDDCLRDTAQKFSESRQSTRQESSLVTRLKRLLWK